MFPKIITHDFICYLANFHAQMICDSKIIIEATSRANVNHDVRTFEVDAEFEILKVYYLQNRS